MYRLVFLILTTILFASSCEDPYVTIYSTFIIENKCGVETTIVVYNNVNDTILIPNNKAYEMEKYYDNEIAEPFDCDSIGINFGDYNEIIYTLRNDSSRNPLLNENYTKEKTSDITYKLTYTFTEDDLNIDS